VSAGVVEAAGAVALLLFNGIGVWVIRGWFTRMSNVMDRQEQKLDAFLDRQSQCRESLPAVYATREELKQSLSEAHEKLGELDRDSDKHAERLARLEARSDRAA
jgi:DNA repair exonuclease SbcCD ATPase subunit